MNPYEAARLARNLGLSTTEFLDRHTTSSGAYLRSEENGACVFLGEDGCTVHADRPLVCRLYPLGRVVPADGPVGFVEVTPHPRSEGTYGTSGTVADFLEGQGIEPFVEAADRYYEVFLRLVDVLEQHGDLPDADEPTEVTASGERILMDMDAALQQAAEEGEEGVPADLDGRVDAHLSVIDRWIDGARPGP